MDNNSLIEYIFNNENLDFKEKVYICSDSVGFEKNIVVKRMLNRYNQRSIQ